MNPQYDVSLSNEFPDIVVKVPKGGESHNRKMIR